MCFTIISRLPVGIIFVSLNIVIFCFITSPSDFWFASKFLVEPSHNFREYLFTKFIINIFYIIYFMHNMRSWNKRSEFMFSVHCFFSKNCIRKYISETKNIIPFPRQSHFRWQWKFSSGIHKWNRDNILSIFLSFLFRSVKKSQKKKKKEITIFLLTCLCVCEFCTFENSLANEG